MFGSVMLSFYLHKYLGMEGVGSNHGRIPPDIVLIL
jgi:hypothetical protein